MHRRRLLNLWFLVLASLLGAFGLLLLVGWLLSWPTAPPSDAELAKTANSAKPIIEAIHAFENANQMPLKSLSELVPRFLASVPMPEGPADGGWYFQSGARGGRQAPRGKDLVAGKWVLGIAVANTKGPLQFGDYFVYNPSGQYSDSAYGGVLRKVGDWGYYRE